MDYKKELIYISKYVGMRIDYVQAGGGNTSVKISEELMLIKSSGTLLADMTTEYGYSIVNYKKIKEFLFNSNQADEESIMEEALIEGKRPSIETYLHSCTGKYTIHVHSTILNILTCQRNGMKILNEIFPEAIFVDYALPGLELANKLIKSYNEKESIELIFLKNHGVIVNGEDYNDVITQLDETINKVSDYLKIDVSKYNNVSYIYKLYKQVNSEFTNIIYLSENRYILEALEKNEGHLWNYLLFPDAIVYCGVNPVEITGLKEYEKLEMIKQKENAILINYNGYVYISAVSIEKAKEIEDILSASAQIYLNSNGEQLDYINEKEQNKINESDGEKYRKKV